MESGSPHARYALIERKNNRRLVEFRQMSYDWESAAMLAFKNHRSDCVVPLTSGRVAAEQPF